MYSELEQKFEHWDSNSWVLKRIKHIVYLCAYMWIYKGFEAAHKLTYKIKNIK